MYNTLYRNSPLAIIRVAEVQCCVTADADVLYNNFNDSSLYPPVNPTQFPNSVYTCVVATTDQWRVSRCADQHHVVCQSDTVTGIMTTSFYAKTFLRALMV